MERFIAREPVFNHARVVFGYKLLFRSGTENSSPAIALIALDDFRESPEWEPLVPLAIFIKVDFIATPVVSLPLMRALLRAPRSLRQPE